MTLGCVQEAAAAPSDNHQLLNVTCSNFVSVSHMYRPILVLFLTIFHRYNPVVVLLEHRLRALPTGRQKNYLIDICQQSLDSDRYNNL